MSDNPWNSLEVVKIIVSVLTPLSVLVFGWLINRRLKKLDHVQWSNQKLIEKRLALYDETSPLINKLYCFYMWVGYWKDITPEDVIKSKRILDKTINIYRHILGERFYNEYEALTKLLFKTYTGPGQDAKIKSYAACREGDRTKDASYDWNNDWYEDFVTENEVADLKEIDRQYHKLMNVFRYSIGTESTQ